MSIIPPIGGVDTRAAGLVRRVYSGVCHGTLGELIQGPFVRDGDLHIAVVSLPVRRYSWAHFNPGADGDLDEDFAAKPKSRRAMEIYLSLHGRRRPCGQWTYDSELLQGKGMASSTADIVATIRCLDAVFGTQAAPELMAAILREIERSDSVFLEGHALYLSSRQEVVRPFSANPRFHICYIDEGTTIDTDAVGELLLAHYQHQLPDYLVNLDATVHAFQTADSAGICACATRSARLAQDVLPKRTLDALLTHQAHFRADGIVVAHTGSLIGYLYIDRPSPTAIGELSSFFRGLGYQCRFVDTGF